MGEVQVLMQRLIRLHNQAARAVTPIETKRLRLLIEKAENGLEALGINPKEGGMT